LIDTIVINFDVCIVFDTARVESGFILYMTLHL